MATVPVLCRCPRTTAWIVATLAFGASAFGGQGMRFFPIRLAPLGSDAGTVGDPVTPQFNEDLGCWELQLPAGTDGFEVDLGLEVFGWGMATGSPALGAIQATVMSAGYNNGSGGNLNPKGWPDDPGTGAYQAKTWCDPALGGDGGPCNTGPFGPCVAGICIPNPDWVMPPCAEDLPAIATNILDYAWATVATVDCNEDDGQVKTLGGLILEVPGNAAGTYLIDFNRNPNQSFMSSFAGEPIPGIVFTPACITLVCQSDADCDDDFSCTTDRCDEATSTCENIIAQNSCLIDDICYLSGQPDPAESCHICTSNLSQTDWSNRPAGFACGDASDTDCNHPDTCDGAGTCLANEEPDGATCTDEGNDCTRDFCNGGFCLHRPWASGTRCGDATDVPCNGADTCDGRGSCLNNVLPDDTPCPNGNFCDGAELCLGGVCQSAEPPCDVETELCDELDDECRLLGDFDGDLQITQTDFSHWLECETGPIGGSYPTGCEIFDFGQNGFVDLQDNARFQNAFDMP